MTPWFAGPSSLSGHMTQHAVQAEGPGADSQPGCLLDGRSPLPFVLATGSRGELACLEERWFEKGAPGQGQASRDPLRDMGLSREGAQDGEEGGTSQASPTHKGELKPLQQEKCSGQDPLFGARPVPRSQGPQSLVVSTLHERRCFGESQDHLVFWRVRGKVGSW